MNKRELLKQELDYCEDSMIDLLYDLAELSKRPNKQVLIKLTKSEDHFINYDTAFPHPYFEKIKEIYPDVINGNYVFDYTKEKFGELININNFIVERLIKSL